MDKFEARLMDAAQAVVDSADSEGCSEDLTVVSQETIDELSEALTIYKVEILSEEKTMSAIQSLAERGY